MGGAWWKWVAESGQAERRLHAWAGASLCNVGMEEACRSGHLLNDCTLKDLIIVAGTLSVEYATSLSVASPLSVGGSRKMQNVTRNNVFLR